MIECNKSIIETVVARLKEDFPDIDVKTIEDLTCRIIAYKVEYLNQHIYIGGYDNTHILLELGTLLNTDGVTEQVRIAIKQTQKQEQ